MGEKEGAVRGKPQEKDWPVLLALKMERGQEPRNVGSQPLEAGTGMKIDSPPELSEKKLSFANTLVSAQQDPFGAFDI